MPMTDVNPLRRPWLQAALVATVLGAAAAAPAPAAAAARAEPRTADYILAVVNNELVTNGELNQRLARVRESAARGNQRLPPDDELRRQVFDALIDERVQITYARENGIRIDEAELDRAVQNVAVQNQITMPQLRERLRTEGVDYQRFRNNVRDQLMVERVREREVQQRIRITDAEVDKLIDEQRAAAGSQTEYNIAQILVTVPEGAPLATETERRIRAENALARVRAGESFDAVAREMSEDANRAAGGVIGLRPADRLPDVFVERVKALQAGQVAPALLRTGAGFHVLKLVERREASAFQITQTRARHILLRPSAQLSQDAAMRRLEDFKRQIESGRASFEALARANSEDGSAPAGGELGWASPGTFVPEFEETMNALPIGGLSAPVVSRFGVHLIQVLERRNVELDVRQQREQARNVLRERKFEEAYTEWATELRGRAYVEMREAPQ
ncbi:peptidylprolyl isomerase [Piscinibacter sakaiensis]|uniref:peptidylprolyl isomerase n=1 Tax=Piscinibacter sakaiensis TaxID=1547922 RepID=UPI00372CBC09